MLEIFKSQTYGQWIECLRDNQARDRIQMRITRLALGNPGHVRNLRHGVSELKVDFGPGYRVYYLIHGKALVVLLCGGDKASQAKDITNAYRIADDWRDSNGAQERVVLPL